MLFAPPINAATPSPTSKTHHVTMSAVTIHVPIPRSRTALTPRVMYPAATHLGGYAGAAGGTILRW